MTLDNSFATPIERRSSLTVGSVEAVSPGRIDVRLDLEAPQTTALNTGTPVAFPRLNGFVVVPNEAGALVGIVVWLGIESSSYPRRPGVRDLGLVDLPFPSRKLHLVPVGTLERTGSEEGFRLERGVVVFPSVGDPVALPSAEQLRALTSGSAEDSRVPIGRALLGNDAEVRVDPDKLFGRHLAVLGNTGSGKSCSVAGLIRWSLDAARKARTDGEPNCRFVVLDPNGEYREALHDLPGFRLLQVPPPETVGANPFRVPAWLLNSHEWASVTVASTRSQRPALTEALRNLRLGFRASTSADEKLAASVLRFRSSIAGIHSAGPEYWAREWKTVQSTGAVLSSFQRSVRARLDADKPWYASATALVSELEGLEKENLTQRGSWEAFDEGQLLSVLDHADALLKELPEVPAGQLGNEDVPIQFDADLLIDELDLVVTSGGFEDVARFIGGLRIRLRSLLSDERIRPVIHPDEEPSLEAWLEELLGAGEGSSVVVIDLSLVPSEVIEIVVAVTARMIFEALQRHRRRTGTSLPTTLVLEEAHTFVHHRPFGDEHTSPGEMCVRVFERIAREGRKFGLGLVLSSQRPSELSATILAQCNSFLLHRLVNDRDQQLVGKLVPDSLSGLLDDLPSLPARHALLLGWASALPTLLEMRELPEHQRPKSADPDFWDVWTGRRSADVDWAKVARHWTGDRSEDAPA